MYWHSRDLSCSQGSPPNQLLTLEMRIDSDLPWGRSRQTEHAFGPAAAITPIYGLEVRGARPVFRPGLDRIPARR